MKFGGEVKEKGKPRADSNFVCGSSSRNEIERRLFALKRIFFSPKEIGAQDFGCFCQKVRRQFSGFVADLQFLPKKHAGILEIDLGAATKLP